MVRKKDPSITDAAGGTDDSALEPRDGATTEGVAVTQQAVGGKTLPGKRTTESDLGTVDSGGKPKGYSTTTLEDAVGFLANEADNGGSDTGGNPKDYAPAAGQTLTEAAWQKLDRSVQTSLQG